MGTWFAWGRCSTVTPDASTFALSSSSSSEPELLSLDVWSTNSAISTVAPFTSEERAEIDEWANSIEE